jgi:hypothetical protein
LAIISFRRDHRLGAPGALEPFVVALPFECISNIILLVQNNIALAYSMLRACRAWSPTPMVLPFTKSRFRMALECPTKLYYARDSVIYPSVNTDTEFLNLLATGGFQVGELAKRMHPDGEEITDRGHTAQLGHTAELMRRDTVTLFEAAFAADDFFIRADILRKRGNQADLVEVKSKSAPEEGTTGVVIGDGPNIHASWMPYVQDLAFQTYVLRKAMPELQVRSLLMLPDPAAVATVDAIHARFSVRRVEGGLQFEVVRNAVAAPLGEPLLVELDLTALVENVLSGNFPLPPMKCSWSAYVNHLAATWKQGRKLAPVIGGNCANCEFRVRNVSAPQRSGFVECWTAALDIAPDELVGDTVLDIWNFRHKTRLIAERRWRLSDVTDDDLQLRSGEDGLSRSQRQRMQLDGALPRGQPFYLDRDLMRREMAKWNWPLHFVDFETARPALPFHKGRRPYGIVAFQFSHHILEADGALRHAGEVLLATPGIDPNIAFLRELRTAVGKTGTVFMWSRHERTVLQELRRDLSGIDGLPDGAELAAFLDGLLYGPRSLYDLAKLAERAFFHPATKARSSLKVVLPAVLGCSNWLRERYSRPIYGAAGGIPSRNFLNFAWWQAAGGSVADPYGFLGDICADLPEIADSDDDKVAIASGGAASAAYARLQAEDLEPRLRQAIESALKRYCEIDTLAMAMVVEAWRDWSKLSVPRELGGMV